VDSAELLDQVRQLRGEGMSPKQIARALGMTPSAVAPLIRAIAAQSAAAIPPPLLGCWINTGWSRGLAIDPAQHWEDMLPAHDEAGGLVSLLVARRHRFDKVSMCGFLTDVYCLGVKNVLGPDITDELALRQFVPTYYTAYPHGWQSAPIELAQHLVFGAIAYARSLGFEPHPDFGDAAEHLGDGKDPQRSLSARTANRSTSPALTTTHATSSRRWNTRSAHHPTSTS
jgi:hypothetical protein